MDRMERFHRELKGRKAKLFSTGLTPGLQFFHENGNIVELLVELDLIT
jgi:hypothetical protein